MLTPSQIENADRMIRLLIECRESGETQSNWKHVAATLGVPKSEAYFILQELHLESWINLKADCVSLNPPSYEFPTYQDYLNEKNQRLKLTASTQAQEVSDVPNANAKPSLLNNSLKDTAASFFKYIIIPILVGVAGSWIWWWLKKHYGIQD